MAKFEKDYVLAVANIAMSQIITGVGQNVVMSWGIRCCGCGEVTLSNHHVAPCLILKVSGLIHTGVVIVALNVGRDTYEVQLRTFNGEPVSEWHTDVYYDELGSLLDSLIERPKGMTDEEYQELSEIDSFIKCLLDI